jgi:hypothetical protein
MANQDTVKKIAKALAESEEIPLAQITRVVELLGEEKSLSLLADTLKIEKEGGMKLPDGSRRRSPGGVFFLLARQMMPAEDAKRIFADRKSKPKKEVEDAPVIRPRPRVVDVVPDRARVQGRPDAASASPELGMGRERARLRILEAVAELSPPDRYRVVRDVLGELGTQLRALEAPAERPEGQGPRVSERGGRRRD